MADGNTELTEVQPVPAMFAPGTLLLDKYRIDAKLGSGGFGLVLRARDLALDQDVAIKILRADIELDRENEQRFRREAQAIARLKSPHVVRLFDVGTLDDGAPYMVMELLRGEDLGTLLACAGALPAALAAGYVLQACDALAEAHALGIIHRDVKPTNLFLTRAIDGTQLVKMLDFGISKAPTLDGELTLTHTASVLGTPAYMSPEQMRSARQVDARSDIWSLGVVLYELVEGRLPFSAHSFGELVLETSTQPHAAMTAAPELDGVIARCLGKDPSERYANVAELAADLAAQVATDEARASATRIARTLGVAGAPRVAPRTRTRSRRTPIAIAGAVTAVAAVVAIVLAFQRPASHSPARAVPAPPPTAPTAPPHAAALPAASPPSTPARVPPAAPPAHEPAASATTARSRPSRGTPAVRAAPAAKAKRACDPYSNPQGC